MPGNPKNWTYKTSTTAPACYTHTLRIQNGFDMIYQRLPDTAIVVHYNFRAHHDSDPGVRRTTPKEVLRHLKRTSDLAPLELRQQL